MSINLNSFDNKEVKNTYKSICKMSDGNRKSRKIIDTDEERNALRTYVDTNRDNINDNDMHVLSVLSKMDLSVPTANVEVKGNNNSVLVVVGNDNTVVDTFKKHEESAEAQEEQVVEKQEVEDLKEEQPQESKTKSYTVQKGDYWYKMVSEQYETASNSEIMEIVRKFKQDYFEANRNDLIRKGYTSAKSGFFLSVGSAFKLPETVEVNGKSYKLKH